MEGMLPLINPPFPTRGRRPREISHFSEVTRLVQRSPESILKAFTSLLWATQVNAGPILWVLTVLNTYGNGSWADVWCPARHPVTRTRDAHVH